MGGEAVRTDLTPGLAYPDPPLRSGTRGKLDELWSEPTSLLLVTLRNPTLIDLGFCDHLATRIPWSDTRKKFKVGLLPLWIRAGSVTFSRYCCNCGLRSRHSFEVQVSHLMRYQFLASCYGSEASLKQRLRRPNLLGCDLEWWTAGQGIVSEAVTHSPPVSCVVIHGSL